MHTTKMMAIVAGIALLAVPGTALAENGERPENDIDQERNDSYVNQDEIISNDFDFLVYNGGNGDDGAYTAVACQFNAVGEAWVAAIAFTSGLAVLDDSDRSAFIVPGDLFPFEGGNGRFSFDTTAESSTSSCETPIGPVFIAVAGAGPGWGEAAPMGGNVAGAMTAAASGWNGKYDPTKDNDLDQKSNDADVYQDDVISNDAKFDYDYVDHSALAGAVCQANVVGRATVWAIAVTEMEARLKDKDRELEIIGEPINGDAQSIDADLELSRAGLFANLTIDNDHTAVASCSQPIESITILVGRDDVLPPQS